MREALASLPHRVVLAWGVPRLATAFVSGGLSALAMAPFDFFPILALTLPVLVWLIDGAAAAGGRVRVLRSAAAAGWWFGFGYFLAGLWWIGAAFLVDAEAFGWMMPFAVVALPAGLALFPACGALLARLIWTNGPERVLALAVGLGASEWLRGRVLTGFPWNSFGQALGDNTLLGQAASIVGLDGLTLIALAVFAAPATLVGSGRWSRLAPSLLGAAVLAGLAAFGAVRLAGASDATIPGATVRIVQPNVPQDDKFRPERGAEILERYVALSEAATSPDRQGLAGTTLLIWPESAFPFLVEENPQALAIIADLLPSGTTLVTGAARADRREGQAPRIYNSVLALGPDGSVMSTYDKVRLVPFGEFLPFQAQLEALGITQLTKLPGGFSAGPGAASMLLPGGLRIGPLICYEAIFPTGAIPEDARPDVLVNLTNDAWFGDTPGPRQHLAQARLRAVEQGLPLLRSANTGISAVIDPYGRVMQSVPLGIAATLDAVVPAPLPPTLYARHGNTYNAGLYLLFLVGVFVAARRTV